MDNVNDLMVLFCYKNAWSILVHLTDTKYKFAQFSKILILWLFYLNGDGKQDIYTFLVY